jgi:hypothetical protein
VQALEDVPDDEKDWHPRSNGQVLDLVHPSLYRVVYGRTLQVENLGLSNEYTEVIDAPEDLELDDFDDDDSNEGSEDDDSELSHRFMWLPTDFRISSDGKTTHTLGYINNLHPVAHSATYRAIERIIAAYVPCSSVS